MSKQIAILMTASLIVGLTIGYIAPDFTLKPAVAEYEGMTFELKPGQELELIPKEPAIEPPGYVLPLEECITGSLKAAELHSQCFEYYVSYSNPDDIPESLIKETGDLAWQARWEKIHRSTAWWLEQINKLGWQGAY